MSGLGGDELFAGYDRYSGMLLSQYYSRLVPAFLHRMLVQPLVRRLPEPADGGSRMDHAKRFVDSVLQSPAKRYLGFVSTLDSRERHRLYSDETAGRIDFEATESIVTRPFEDCAAPDDLTRALYVDLKTYLPEDILALSDRLSMWHSLEVRVPFVDHPLVELSARLPIRLKLDWRRKKILLKRIAAHRLPAEVMNHRKQGFESPMAAWLRTDLAAYARDILSQGRLGQSGLFDVGHVTARLEEHLAGRRRNSKLLFSLIMFQQWYERHGARP
jgi:asparagine synthase (glutamine-hydrolysing)